MPNFSGVTYIESSSQSSFALAIRSGELWGWGYTVDNNLLTNCGSLALSPIKLAAVANPLTVAAGGFHAHAIAGAGSNLLSWGQNSQGAMANGATFAGCNVGVHQALLAPAPGAPNTGAQAVSGGSMHGVAILANGSAVSWGHGFYMQLGNPSAGNTAVRAVPLLAALNTPFAAVDAVDAGDFHTLVIRASDRTVWAVGRNFTRPSATAPTSIATTLFT